jgi:hypothetical protein
MWARSCKVSDGMVPQDPRASMLVLRTQAYAQQRTPTVAAVKTKIIMKSSMGCRRSMPTVKRLESVKRKMGEGNKRVRKRSKK